MKANVSVLTVEITRRFNAPPHAVWRAWTDPELLGRWWWPERFHTEYALDVREGGSFQYRTADVPGMGVLDVSGTYRAVDPPRALEYTWRWEGQTEPDTFVRLGFVDAAGNTELRLRHGGFADPQERDNHIIGWTDCLDRLAALLNASA
jgi:uncharacterized protein YndB with AHSA1/START domain